MSSQVLTLDNANQLEIEDSCYGKGGQQGNAGDYWVNLGH